jgi:hypothetical protein
MNLWKWKRTSRSEGERPATAIRSSTVEAETPEVAAVPVSPVDVAVPEAPVDVAIPEAPVAIADPDRLPPFTLPPAGVSLERSFCQDGFVVVPQVFDQAEMAELRRAAIAQFPDNRPPFQPSFSSTALFQGPFQPVFRSRRFIQALRTVLGEDFVFINEFALHDSFWVGWHTDTATIEGKGNHEFHWSPGFCVVNAAIYLQDHSLDVVPGSYVRDDPFAAMMRRDNGLPNINRMPAPEPNVDPYRDAVSVRFRAGDVLIFHLRLHHRSSPRTSEAQSDLDRKLAIFMLAGANNTQTRRYRAWLDEYGQMNGTTKPMIPDDFRSLLNGVGHTVI